MIAIILVNYNNFEDTTECLESLLKLENVDFNIFVIDNCSTNDSWEKLQSWSKVELKINYNAPQLIRNLVYPLIEKPIDSKFILENDLGIESYSEKVVFVKANKNKGFAAGNNIALKYLLNQPNFEYAWLLNNDTVVEKNALFVLKKTYSENNNIGILGSKLRYYDEPNKIQAIGGIYNPFSATAKHIYSHQDDKKSLEIPKFDFVIGASMFVSKKSLQQIGLLNEIYFLYFEDIEWCKKSKKKGFENKIEINSIVYHKEGSTIGSAIDGAKKSYISDYFGTKNKLVFTQINNKKYYLFVYLSMFLVLANRIKRFQLDRILMVLKIMIGK